MASGSDHGDCSIIIWDLKNFRIMSKFEGHSAAVVSLLSLNNSETIISGNIIFHLLIRHIYLINLI